MTIRIISVGLSLPDYYEKSEGQTLNEAIPWTWQPPEVQRKCLAGPGADWLPQDIVKQLTGFNQDACAEWSTVVAHTGHRCLPDGDTAYLLASDTTSGLTAAAAVACGLAGGDMGRVIYCDLPVDLQAQPPFAAHPVTGKVAVYRVPGMDALQQEAFESSMVTIGCLGAEVLRQTRGAPQPVEIYLSGGYKASIPFMIALAEGLAAYNSQVHAWCLFEGTLPEGENRRPISIPLRQLWWEDLAAVATAYCQGPGMTPLTAVAKDPCDKLRGYTHVWDSETGSFHLTSFGRGLTLMSLQRPVRKKA